MFDTMLSQDGWPVLMLVVGIGVGMVVLAGAQQILRVVRASPGQLWPDGETERESEEACQRTDSTLVLDCDTIGSTVWTLWPDDDAALDTPACLGVSSAHTPVDGRRRA